MAKRKVNDRLNRLSLANRRARFQLLLSQIVPLSCAFLYPACGGLGIVMSKRILENVPPLPLLIIQLSASAAFLWVVVLIRGLRPSFQWQTIRGGLTGVLEPGINHTFCTLGLALTTASNTSLIGATEPIMVIFLALVLLRERISPLLGVLTVIAVMGVILVIGFAPGEISAGNILGDFLVAIGTLFAAVHVIISARILVDLEPLPLSALQQSAALVWALVVWVITTLWQGQGDNLAHISPMVWAWAAATGIVQYALAFWLFLIALRGLKTRIAPLYLYLVPVFTVSGAYLFLGEQLSILQSVGAGFILVTVICVSWLHME